MVQQQDTLAHHECTMARAGTSYHRWYALNLYPSTSSDRWSVMDDAGFPVCATRHVPAPINREFTEMICDGWWESTRFTERQIDPVIPKYIVLALFEGQHAVVP
jgi:hypothetical protein